MEIFMSGHGGQGILHQVLRGEPWRQPDPTRVGGLVLVSSLPNSQWWQVQGQNPDGKEMRRHDVAYVEWSLRRFSWSPSPEMLSKWPQGRHRRQLVSLTLNQFLSVKLKPGCLQLVWENQASLCGPHSCILGLYKHRPGRKCLSLASLCYDRKCCFISAAHNLSMVSTVSHEDLGCKGPAAFSDLCPPADHMVLSHWKHPPNPFENELSFAMPWLKSCWLEISSNFPWKCFPSCCTHLPCTCFTLW